MFVTFISVLLICTRFISNNDAVVQDFYWRDYVPGDIPYDAIQGAPGRYIGQIYFGNNILPATIYPHSNVAVAEFSGKKIIKDNIKILCTLDVARFYWEFVDFDKPLELQLKDVVKGGFQSDISLNVFIGKQKIQDEWKIGKVVPYDHKILKGLWVWNQNEQSALLRKFYILKYNLTLEIEDKEILCKN